MAIYFFSQMLRLTEKSIKPFLKLSRRHLINSFDVFNIQGLTVCTFLNGELFEMTSTIFFQETLHLRYFMVLEKVFKKLDL